MRAYLLDDPDKILEDPTAPLAGDDSGCEIAQNVGADGLNRVRVLELIQQQVDHGVAALDESMAISKCYIACTCLKPWRD